MLSLQRRKQRTSGPAGAVAEAFAQAGGAPVAYDLLPCAEHTLHVGHEVWHVAPALDVPQRLGGRGDRVVDPLVPVARVGKGRLPVRRSVPLLPVVGGEHGDGPALHPGYGFLARGIVIAPAALAVALRIRVLD